MTRDQLRQLEADLRIAADNLRANSDHSRYDHLLHVPEEKDIVKALKDVEEYKPFD